MSSHGFAQNQLILWKYPGMTKVAELTGEGLGHVITLYRSAAVVVESVTLLLLETLTCLLCLDGMRIWIS